MVSKRWNALKASLWGAIIGAAYIAGMVAFEGRMNEPLGGLIGEMLGGAIGIALVAGIFAQARNWATGAR